MLIFDNSKSSIYYNITSDVVKMILVRFQFFFSSIKCLLLKCIEIRDQIKFKSDALFPIILVFEALCPPCKLQLGYIKEEDLRSNLTNLTVHTNGGVNIAAKSVKIKTNRRTALLHNNGIRCVLL